MKILILIIGISLFQFDILASDVSINETFHSNEFDIQIQKWMKKGKIPGLSIVILKDKESYLKSYGYADIKKKELVTSKTLFEIGSCSKAFTALAILKLEKEKKIDLESYVSDYIPWFHVYYKDSISKITLRQLLFHTSGIPWYTISLIPRSNDDNSLEQTIRAINGIALHNLPGTQYEYATINYDVLALIIAIITKDSFEDYMQQILYNDLKMRATFIGRKDGIENISTGYKIGFFRSRKYDAPIFKGNNAAGYIISNAEDLALWLQYQMRLAEIKYDSLIEFSHMRDETVIPHNLYSYSYGWNVSLRGDGEIYHDGLNPNFSSYIGFRKKDSLGVIVLANSNSSYTHYIGRNLMNMLEGEKNSSELVTDRSLDKASSVISILLSIYILFVFFYNVYIVNGIIKKTRKKVEFSIKKLKFVILTLFLLIPYVYGIYILPKAIAGFDWQSAIVWTPLSFPVAAYLCFGAILLSYFSYLLSLLFPEKNQYLKDAPKVILLSLLSGLANMVIILIITSSLSNNIQLKFILYFFGLCMFVYLVGRKIVQTKMIYITRNIIYDLRMRLINKIFLTSYENFEKIDRGRIYSTMNDDIGTIGQSSNTIVNIITSAITAGGAFIYMASLAFWATIVTALLVIIVSSLYYVVSKKTEILFEDARETRTVYMRLLNGLIDGFKELSIHRIKKNEYKNDVEASTDEYRYKISKANVKFVNAFLIGESLLILVLATVVFAIPMVFPEINNSTILSFIIILLYLIGPVNSILSSVPQLIQLRIAVNRVKDFTQDIPANLSLNQETSHNIFEKSDIKSFKAQNICFKYSDNNGKDGFSVGPINLEIKKGETLFIIGGNGSGKTTLAKLITGLYPPNKGEIFIDDKKIPSNIVGEYFSAVFNPLHLFQKLYDTKIKEKDTNRIINNLLETLQLENKVSINDNMFSTIELSGGQRKRLALLQCYLENRPIYLFDEWAADQDPVYRKLFYRELIPEMKKQGKIIIAITHDDHYFDVADKVLKLDMGKVEFLKKNTEVKKGIFTEN